MMQHVTSGAQPFLWVFAVVVRVTYVCPAVSPCPAMVVLCALSSAQLPPHFSAHCIAHVVRTLVQKQQNNRALPWMEGHRQL